MWSSAMPACWTWAFIAFYGLGAYIYALLSSGKFDQHWPSWAALLVVGLVSIAFGLLLGSPSLRLSGDYLAIVNARFWAGGSSNWA